MNAREVADMAAWRQKKSLQRQRAHRSETAVAIVFVVLLSGMLGWIVGYLLGWVD